MPTQARLLRVLESGEFIKVGSSKVQKTDVRIVAATNVNLTQAIAEGRFREDLYYRLNTVPIQIPPLRERGDDVLLLFRKFAADFAAKYRMPAIQLTEDMYNSWYEGDQTYDGTEKTLYGYSLMDSNNYYRLAEDEDYVVTYENNINVGTATATFTGIGNYTGSFTKNFNIVPADIYSADID